MPRATINPDYRERKDLKSLPPEGDEEGGFVILRRMSYDAYLERREIAARVSVESEVSGKGRGRQVTDQRTLVEMMQREVAFLEMRECIVEHNLTDENGNLLDFTKKSTLRKLDPRVGDEIGIYIDELNQFDEGEDDDDALPPSVTESGTPS